MHTDQLTLACTSTPVPTSPPGGAMQHTPGSDQLPLSLTPRPALSRGGRQMVPRRWPVEMLQCLHLRRKGRRSTAGTPRRTRTHINVVWAEAGHGTWRRIRVAHCTPVSTSHTFFLPFVRERCNLKPSVTVSLLRFWLLLRPFSSAFGNRIRSRPPSADSRRAHIVRCPLFLAVCNPSAHSLPPPPTARPTVVSLLLALRPSANFRTLQLQEHATRRFHSRQIKPLKMFNKASLLVALLGCAVTLVGAQPVDTSAVPTCVDGCATNVGASTGCSGL